MKKIVILGGTGLLGHKLHYYFNQVSNFDVVTTVRRNTWNHLLEKFGEIRNGVDATDLQSISKVCRDADYVINALGLIWQKGEFTRNQYLDINGIFPHQLAAICNAQGTHLIHISSDAVFDGLCGNYSESDQPNNTNIYGYSKAIGEIRYGPNLTIRTSIIGTELGEGYSLLEWFRKNSGNEINGYTRALWNGITSEYLAKTLIDLISNSIVFGLYNLSTDMTISKYDLLNMLNEELQLMKKISRDDTIVSDCTLNNTKFKKTFKINIPGIEKQIRNIVELDEI